jgi:DNA-directed RNA polymerase III subunit RPC8
MFLLVSALYILTESWSNILTCLQATISDLVQIRPEDFSKFSAVAIEDNINEKYANKVSINSTLSSKKVLTRYFRQVIQKIGLCIGFYDLLKSSDGLIGHGTGLVNVNGIFPSLQPG